MSDSHMPKATRSFPEFFFHLKRSGFDPTVCIDVGAANGTPSIYQAFKNAKHIVFEPLPEFQQPLAEALTGYDHEIHRCALMAQSGEALLLKHSDLYGSSMMHKRSQEDDNVIKVPVSTLDERLKDEDLSGHVLLKTDCQGADLDVIKGGLSTLSQCDVVILEASMFRFWGEHHPDFFDIVSFMNDQGFAVYDLLDGMFRPLDKALGQIDIAFARKDGFLRENTSW
ncbi:FkbM family methyltransferase [Parvularcula lutaonensis]|uniref:FkbM family methyltransferase n=1 Tax=Parvularcula lutaonensis TaxID=491923 RepID=A0ABV7ME96_9PROT|nr:FkbM family methyltransferase [Parvularcula lutaonensis]GGY54984.1 methyltransferase FkbM [Parvularcula lutaonensis]